MAKLVKLTTTLDKTRDTNGYVSICNDDILLEPNAKVSLLNCHISSGVLASYDINGTDTIGQTPAGQIMGNIQLGTNDRQRNVIIANDNNYNIDTLLSEIQSEMNSSLVFNSTTTYTSPNALDIPATVDFGLETGITTDPTTNQVTINYNSAVQKYTSAPFSYSNKNTGINIDASGTISYGKPSGYLQFGLDRTLATRTEVFSTESIGTQLGKFDVVNLSSSTFAIPNQTVIINDVAVDATNTDNPFVIDTALTDTVNNIIYENVVSTTTAPYQVGQSITMDDGAGQPPPPVGTGASANTTYGKIKDVSLVLKNTDNYLVDELEFEPLGSFLEYEQDIVSGSTAAVPGTVNTFTMTVDLAFADVATYHYQVNSLVYILDATDAIYAVGQIKASAANTDPTKTDLTLAVNALDANPLETPRFVKLVSGEFFFSPTGKTTIDDTQIKTIPAGTGVYELGVFDDNLNLLATVRLDSTTIETLNGGVYSFNLVPNSYQIFVPGNPVLTQFDAFTQWVKTYVLSPVFDITKLRLTFVDRVITHAPLQLANFAYADGQVLKIFNYPGMTNIVNTTINYAPYEMVVGTDQFTVVPIGGNELDQWDKLNAFYKAISNNPNGMTLSADNDQIKKIELETLTGTLPLTNAYPVRMWIGTDVQETYKITLDIAPARRITLSNYDLIVKGKDNLSQRESLAVEDTRLSHSCGRIAFKVIDVNQCSFGCIPETFNFQDQTLSTAFVEIKIRQSTTGGGYLVYQLNVNGATVQSRELQAKTGDTVIIQYGVTPSLNDFEYTDVVSNTTNPNTIQNNIQTYARAANANNYDEDRQKILITVLRNGGTNKYIHLGCVFPDPNLNDPDETRAAMTIPWTPRSHPFRPAAIWDNSLNLRMYVAPNLAKIRPLELTPSSQLIKDANGVITQLHATSIFHDPSQHETDNLEIPRTKLSAFSSSFTFTFTNAEIQKILGYKAFTKTLSGSTGFWQADISYLKAYLPEGVVILLDNISRMPSFDCGQVGGGQRQILATSINGQDKIGEISIEPNNLYRIALNNKDVVNLRKFSLSFEDLFGKRLILQDARVSATLLFE